jgi:hypothetical protein
MVTALGLSHAELVTAINELLASVREILDEERWLESNVFCFRPHTHNHPSTQQHKLGAHRHADGRELFKAKKPEEGQK